MGAPLAQIARLRTLAGDRLLLEVPDGTWKKEIERLKPQILERLARDVPCAPVTELSFVIGSVREPRHEDPTPAPAERMASGLPDGMRRALDQIGDSDLRLALGQVIGRYLSLSSLAEAG